MSTKLRHGSFSVESVFDIEQMKYGANDDTGQYWELLEIKDPPPGKAPFVLVAYSSGRSKDDPEAGLTFYAYPSRETALAAWNDISYTRLASHLHEVFCGRRNPWFYARSLEDVDGDFAKS